MKRAIENCSVGVCLGFTSLHSLIGYKSSHHFLNQSDEKLKPIVTCLHAFSRARCLLHVFAASSDWFTALFTFIVIGLAGRVIALVWLLRHSIENNLILPMI